jgi:hypothetical protein
LQSGPVHYPYCAAAFAAPERLPKPPPGVGLVWIRTAAKSLRTIYLFAS